MGYVLKIERLDQSRNIGIKTGKRSIDSSDVGGEFGSAQLQSDLKHKLVNLSIELDPKERHPCQNYL